MQNWMFFEPDEYYEGLVKDFKLSFDAMPVFAHGKSVRTAVGQSLWTKIRSAMMESTGFVCGICGATPADDSQKRNWHVHEDWEYDKENCVMKLAGVGVICKDCHNANHIGRFERVATSSEDWDRLFKHMAKVNDTEVDVVEYAFTKFKHGWMTGTGKFAKHNPRDKSLADSEWKYSIDCDIPLKDKAIEKLRSKNLLA